MSDPSTKASRTLLALFGTALAAALTLSPSDSPARVVKSSGDSLASGFADEIREAAGGRGDIFGGEQSVGEVPARPPQDPTVDAATSTSAVRSAPSRTLRILLFWLDGLRALRLR